MRAEQRNTHSGRRDAIASKELANTVGIGEVTMGKVMQINEHAPTVIREALDRGELSINRFVPCLPIYLGTSGLVNSNRTTAWNEAPPTAGPQPSPPPGGDGCRKHSANVHLRACRGNPPAPYAACGRKPFGNMA